MSKPYIDKDGVPRFGDGTSIADYERTAGYRLTINCLCGEFGLEPAKPESLFRPTPTEQIASFIIKKCEEAEKGKVRSTGIVITESLLETHRSKLMREWLDGKIKYAEMFDRWDEKEQRNGQ
jgi:hypothetical protein